MADDGYVRLHNPRTGGQWVCAKSALPAWQVLGWEVVQDQQPEEEDE